MLDHNLVDFVSETIANALLFGYVKNDRIEWSVDGLFERSKRQTRKGTVVDVEGKWLTVRFDDERRPDMIHQKIRSRFMIRKLQDKE